MCRSRNEKPSRARMLCLSRVWKKGWLSASFNGLWFGSFCFLFSGKCYQGRYLCAIMSRQLADGRRAFSSLGFAFMLGKGKFCWVWLGRSALRFHSWLTHELIRTWLASSGASSGLEISLQSCRNLSCTCSNQVGVVRSIDAEMQVALYFMLFGKQSLVTEMLAFVLFSLTFGESVYFKR